MEIGTFLKVKDRPVITVGPQDSITAAIQKLVDNRVGALPVIDDKEMLLGIISERDMLKVFLRHGETGITRVQDVMTRDVVVGAPEDDLDYAACVMRQEKVRHLPIVVGQKLYGIVSMRDVVGIQLSEAQAEIRHLKSW